MGPTGSQTLSSSTDSFSNYFPGQGSSTVDGFSDQHHESWWAKMKAIIIDFVFLGGLDVALLQPNCSRGGLPVY